MATAALLRIRRISLQGRFDIHDEGAPLAVLVKYAAQDFLSDSFSTQFLFHRKIPPPVVFGQAQHHSQANERLIVIVGGIVDVHDIQQMDEVIVRNLLLLRKRRLIEPPQLHVISIPAIDMRLFEFHYAFLAYFAPNNQWARKGLNLRM